MAAAEPAERVAAPRLARAARGAFALAERLQWSSYDPYDLLLWRYGPRLQASSWFGARIAVQVGKRSGVGVRRLLGVREHEEAKTLSDYLQAAVRLAGRGEEWARPVAAVLPARLQALAVPTPSGHGWGLGFPYASRFVNVPRDTPNLYTTTAACQALLDHYELAGEPTALEAAAAGVGFIIGDLGWFERDGKQWLRYWRGSHDRAINVQASAASLLVRLARMQEDKRLAEIADRAVATVLATQAGDGGWPYADDPRARFVDGFHTGFTLQGLAEYLGHRGAQAPAGVGEALERGMRYFRQHLVNRDGLALGFADGRVSHDGQTVAQAVQTLVLCGEPRDRAAAERMWCEDLEALLRGEPGPGGRFPALRWSLGPAVLATTHLLAEARG